MAEFQMNNTKMIYDISGEGIPIVFIHPPAMGRIVFRYQKNLDHYFRIIIPDLSGTGDTSGPEKSVTIQGYVEEIKALLEHLQIQKAVICGYSAGGNVALEFALTFPDKTLGIVLISGYPEVQSAGFKYEHLAGMYLAKKFPSFLSFIIASSHTDDKLFRDEIIRHMKKANRKMWCEFYERSLHYNCTERLHKLSAPLLLMYGAKDFSNQHLRAFEKRIKPFAVIIPKVSHQLPTKEWELVNQSITGFIYEQIKKSH